MSGNFKNQSAGGPPPTYPQQAHYDAGPYDSRGPGSPPPQTQIAPYQQQNDGYGPNYGPPQLGQPAQYGYAQQPNQGWGGGPAPGGYYGGPPQGGMYYQQQPPMGYYGDQRGYGGGYGGGSAGGGICAGLLGALACCCCLDMLI